MLDYRSHAGYYILYGLKGLSIYLIMFCIMHLSSRISFFDFGTRYSLFLIILPLLNFGVASLVLRHSYSYKNQQNDFSFGFLVQAIAFVIALIYLSQSAEIALVIFWSIFRSAYLSYEAFLISKRNYIYLTYLYSYYIFGALLISFGISNKFIDSLENLLLSFVVLEFISVPLVCRHLSLKNNWFVIKSRHIRSRIFKYVIPITAISGLLALFLNSDKLIVSSLGIVDNQESYIFIFFLLLAIHRFVTTPFIMRFSTIFYLSESHIIPRKIIIVGISVIILSILILAIILSYFPTLSYVDEHFIAFSFLVISLYFINLQMLFYKKKKTLYLLARNIFFGVTTSLTVMFTVLINLGFQYIDVAILINSIVMLYSIAHSDLSVSKSYLIALTLTAILLLVVRL